MSASTHRNTLFLSDFVDPHHLWSIHLQTRGDVTWRVKREAGVCFHPVTSLCLCQRRRVKPDRRTCRSAGRHLFVHPAASPGFPSKSYISTTDQMAHVWLLNPAGMQNIYRVQSIYRINTSHTFYRVHRAAEICDLWDLLCICLWFFFIILSLL